MGEWRFSLPLAVSVAEPQQRSRRFAWSLSLLLGLVSGVGFAVWGSYLDDGPVFCVFRASTGLACPACGLTRAFSAAARGEFGRAMELHPLWPLVLGSASVLWLAWSLDTWFGTQWLERLALRLIGTLSVLLLGLWVVRILQGTLPG